MANEKVQIVIKDVCRIVGGSVSKAQEKDADGHAYTIKTGPNAGKPTVKYYIAVAVKKLAGHTHWSQTEWGQKIWGIGHGAFPGIAQSPNFAWKIDDGDSVIPNTKGKKPSDNPNNRGCWILHCSTSLPIKACNADGTLEIPADAVKTGYYVQIGIMCQGNSSGQKPGVYLNPIAVALQGGSSKDEIHQGVNTATLGFGGAALPPGVEAPTNVFAAAVAGTPIPGAAVPPIPGAVPPVAVPPVAVPPVAVPPVAVPPVAVPLPNTAILSVPVPTAPPAPPAPPAGPQMTAKAGGTPYADWIKNGWSDDMLRAHGYMV